MLGKVRGLLTPVECISGGMMGTDRKKNWRAMERARLYLRVTLSSTDSYAASLGSVACTSAPIPTSGLLSASLEDANSILLCPSASSPRTWPIP